MKNQYELHYYNNPDFPIIFNYYELKKREFITPNWHENWEILYFIEGSAKVYINMQEMTVQSGDFIIVPSGALHQIVCETENIRYYCLIVDCEFCAAHGFDVHEVTFEIKLQSQYLWERFNAIVTETEEMENYYQSRILAEIVLMLVYLARNHTDSTLRLKEEEGRAKVDMVKRAFLYIEENYSEKITADMLADEVGFSRYYFAHVFKTVTNMTPGTYINTLRCKRAKKMLSSGRCNVSEAAAECGFDNLSYFTRTYKRYVGELPSDTLKIVE